MTFFASSNLYSQDSEINRDWSAFAQVFDMTSYQGWKFRLRAFVKVENASKLTNARLWARVDKAKGIGFFDNMQDRPITENTWKEYSIEGDIDEKALKLFIGGICFGAGKYYFDNFRLDVKKSDGEWTNLEVINGNFELDSFKDDWKTFQKVKGFETYLISENSFDGKSLIIDANSRLEFGKFIDINGIDIYYEQYGKGDTIILIHGNSESINSFTKQIPELSKHFYILAMDSRGQGNSSKDDKRMTYELMADDVNLFLEKLKIKNANVLGWSDGGNIGLILAMKYRDKVKRLAIMGANLFNDKTSIDGKINNELRAQRKKIIKEDSVKNRFRIEMIDLLLNEPKINPDDLKQIQCPTLVMAGSKDVIKEDHTRLIASKIKNSKLIIFENGTHYEPTENPERFNKTVINFFIEK